MKNIGKIVTGVLMALGLLLGGLVSSAPAQASTQVAVSVADQEVTPESENSATALIRSVYYPYNGNLTGVPLIVNMQDGRTLYRYRDTVTDNVWRYCPPSVSYYLIVENMDGHRVTRSPGTCHVPSYDGQYKVWVKRLN